jgi:hypothetical protein
MPLPIRDEVGLRRAVIATDNAPDTPTRARSMAALSARARVLGLQHLIPPHWSAPAQPGDAQAAQAAQTAQAAEAARTFDCKAHAPRLPTGVLQEAYMRAVREWALIPPDERPPLSREAYAQARVNSLVRFSLNDASARNDDADLILPIRSVQ